MKTIHFLRYDKTFSFHFSQFIMILTAPVILTLSIYNIHTYFGLGRRVYYWTSSWSFLYPGVAYFWNITFGLKSMQEGNSV